MKKLLFLPAFLFTLVFFTSCTSVKKTRWVLLPDTQYYAEKYPEVLDSQINWILKNKKEIDFVLQQGDLTQNNNDKEWQVIQNAFRKLDHQVPYSLAVGNHDMGSAPGKTADKRDTRLFNSYFPLSDMWLHKNFRGSFEKSSMDNVYYFFETGKIKWMVISLEFGPRNAVLEWAGKLAGANRDRVVILNTHSYMYSDSTRQGPGDSWRPQNYGIGKDSLSDAVNDGEQIWEKLVSRNRNIRFVFSGHVLNSGVGTLISINNDGDYVYQMLANYQSEVKGSIRGGNGWLRIIDLDLKKKRLEVKTYSPFINQYKTEPAHQFFINNIQLVP